MTFYSLLSYLITTLLSQPPIEDAVGSDRGTILKPQSSQKAVRRPEMCTLLLVEEAEVMPSVVFLGLQVGCLHEVMFCQGGLVEGELEAAQGH